MHEPWDIRQLARLGEALREANYEFVTPTNATLRRVNGRQPDAKACNATDIFGWGRPMDGAHGAEATPWLARVIETGMARQEQGAWHTPLRAATLGSHLLFHTSGPGSSADAVFFGPDSYRFVHALRCELAARPVHCARALDLGCGAGAGAITLATLHPRAEVTATDISDKALRLAALNTSLAGVPNVAFRNSDLFAETGGGYDLIVANPPFIADPKGRAYRDGGGADGLGICRRIVDGALERLAPGGALMLYTGVAITRGHDPLREHVHGRIRGSGASFTYAELDPDIFGELLSTDAYRNADRIAAVWLVVRKPSM